MISIEKRALEIAEFLNLPLDVCLHRLQQGFLYLHDEVTRDFLNADPKTDDELLNWYRETEAYIWELSAYHLDSSFNYYGMCHGGAVKLRHDGLNSILCLGDGIGDLSLYLHSEGFQPAYHDLRGSQTALFAMARHRTYCAEPPRPVLTNDWCPCEITKHQFDAVVSFDFLEHVPNLPDWAKAIHSCLRLGGKLFAVNRFGCGSEGPMPMHLAVNDRYVEEWVPMMQGIGFEQESGDWFVKKAD